MNKVKALFFDVFGTTVDWRSTVTKGLHARAQAALAARSDSTSSSQARSVASSMSEQDWGSFAQAWRTSYYEFTRRVAAQPGVAPYKTIDEHHLDSLVELLRARRLTGLWSDAEVHDLSLIWHRLDPWPDTVAGIRALNAVGFQTSTLSNGNVKLLTDMAEYARLDWTHVLSAEMFSSYKPDPKVYLGAAERLGLKPEECGMVAAHMGDLDAARGCGFRTVYIERSREETWDAEKIARVRQEGWVDVWVEETEDGFLTAEERLR